MIEKKIIPLEQIDYLGADNKIRLRYRLISKDKNEISEWSPIHTINPSEITSTHFSSDPTSNPLAYSDWNPTSSSDSQSITINLDSGWVNNKFKIPYKNFDIFFTYNYGTVDSPKWGFKVSYYAKITNSVNDVTSPYLTDGTATITDLDSTELLYVGDYLLATSGTGTLNSANSYVQITKIVNENTIQVKSVTTVGGATAHNIIDGLISNIVKYGYGYPSYKYEGTSDSGKFSIDIPTLTNSTSNVYGYQYKITPSTLPHTLFNNYLYDSGVVIPVSTSIQFNTIDGGSPS
jgi:hypothetical protein